MVDYFFVVLLGRQQNMLGRHFIVLWETLAVEDLVDCNSCLNVYPVVLTLVIAHSPSPRF